MRPIEDVELVLQLEERGLTGNAISRVTGIQQATISRWLRSRDALSRRRLRAAHGAQSCELRPTPFDKNAREYSYLLGLYLGDGHMVAFKRGVYKFTISCDGCYPGIISECGDAITSLVPNKVHLVTPAGTRGVIVAAYSKHWPCLFPQHGPAESTSATSFCMIGRRRLSVDTRSSC